MQVKWFAPSVLLLLLMCMLPARVAAQQPNRLPPPGYSGKPPGSEEEDRSRIEKEMAKKENRERQAQLKRDTDSLLKLATELKQYVDKSNENTLSVEVIRKAEDIERLAHSVKEKMKGN